MSLLLSSTHPRWFAASSADLPALLSDHLHCERKAAENALSLVRRYPHRGASVDAPRPRVAEYLAEFLAEFLA